MNTYFRTIGFTKVKTKGQCEKLNSEVLDSPDWRYILSKNSDDIYVEYYKEYAPNMGVAVKGFMDSNEEIEICNVHPFFFTNHEIYLDTIEIQDYQQDYIAFCEEKNTGNELIFYIQNALDYMDTDKSERIKRVNIVGLSTYGTILLPIVKNNTEVKKRQKKNSEYKNLVRRARSGDIESEQKILYYEEETNRAVRERLKEEDFLSIVEGYLLPNAYEDAKYAILGEIIEIEKIINTQTNEGLYLFMLNITGTHLQVCINAKDVVGLPTVGMRFMGQCWLQGKVLY